MIMTIASFFASFASMILQFGFFFGGGDDDESPGFLALMIVALAVYVVSFFLMKALSRYREFAADRGAAEITRRPSALATALMKISGTMERILQQDLRAHSELTAFYIFAADEEVAVQPLLDAPADGEAHRGAAAHRAAAPGPLARGVARGLPRHAAGQPRTPKPAKKDRLFACPRRT